MKNKHIAFIMDGNRRFGKKHNKTETESYDIGAKNMSKIVDYLKTKFRFISFWVFSKSNNVRDISQLKNSIEQDKEMEQFAKNFKCHFIGDIDSLDYRFKKKIQDIKKINEGIEKFPNENIISFFVNYSGSFEIEETFKKIKNNNVKINFENIKLLSLTMMLPNIDILIRTGGRKRLSDFSFFLTAFSEIYFSDVLWPEFSIQNLEEILQNYEKEYFCSFGA